MIEVSSQASKISHIFIKL